MARRAIKVKHHAIGKTLYRARWVPGGFRPQVGIRDGFGGCVWEAVGPMMTDLNKAEELAKQAAEARENAKH